MLVNIRFQVLFHSAPAVLFTFPSRYFSTIGHQVVFRLGGWSPHLLYRFHVSVDTPDTNHFSIYFVYEILTLYDWLSHTIRLYRLKIMSVHNPGIISNTGLASSNFARHYSRNLG